MWDSQLPLRVDGTASKRSQTHIRPGGGRCARSAQGLKWTALKRYLELERKTDAVAAPIIG